MANPRFALARPENRHQIVFGVTPETASAMVKIERARSVWPVAIVSALLLAVVGLIVKFCQPALAWPIALMVAPIGTVTVWKVLSHKAALGEK